MRRRGVLALLGGAAWWPAVARAQQSKMPVVGFLSSRSPEESQSLVIAFRQGLNDGGFVEGRDVTVVYRWAEGKYDRLAGLAAELAVQKVDAIFTAGGPPAALAAKAATSTIPIVFSAANDPVSLGLVANLARPGGNITGMSTLTTGLAAKSLQLLQDVLPNATSIAFLMNPTNPSAGVVLEEVRAATPRLRVGIEELKASSDAEIDVAFAEIARRGTGGLVVYGDPFLDSRRDKLVALAARNKVPAVFAWREYVLAGGLMSYGSNLANSYRRAAGYLARILRGASPADLPVQQPTRFELVINIKTAQALQLTIPETMLVLADEVIE